MWNDNQKERKLRVAAYCRVSTEKEDQTNSFESQCRYFELYIRQNPNWNLINIYADEGITGTNTEKRTEFNRMIENAFNGQIDLIITKEVSRFSRNLVDALSFTRRLKAAGIGVCFLNDGINTLDADAELRLSIMAMIAQEESRKTSDRVQWGQQRQMERGVAFGGDLLGYTVTKGKMIIEPEGAKTVKLIFESYALNKMSTDKIAKQLNAKGITTRLGNRWSANSVAKILRNEKYTGDLIQQKTFTPNYLDHRRKKNSGEKDMKVILNHHEPIISKRLWERAAEERARRRRRMGGASSYSTRYWCSGKIKCGHCGSSYIASKKTNKDGTFYLRWICSKSSREGASRRLDVQGNTAGCDVGVHLRDDVAQSMIAQILDNLTFDKRDFSHKLAIQAAAEDKTRAANHMQRIKQLQKEKEELQFKQRKAIGLYIDGHISKEEYQMIQPEYEQRFLRLDQELEYLYRLSGDFDSTYEQDAIEHYFFNILTGKAHSDIVYERMLDCITVYQNRMVEVKLVSDDRMWTFTLE